MDACNSGGAAYLLLATRTAFFSAMWSATAAVHSAQPERWASASCSAVASSSSSANKATFSRHSQFMILLPTSCLPACPARRRPKTAATVCAPWPAVTSRSRWEYPAPRQSPDISSLPGPPGSALPESHVAGWRCLAAPVRYPLGGSAPAPESPALPRSLQILFHFPAQCGGVPDRCGW